LLLSAGRTAALGPPEAVLDEATLEAVYGWPVCVEKHPRSGRPSVRVVWPDTAPREGR
jgi:ABC-type hemin transport system ATPase subunit